MQKTQNPDHRSSPRFPLRLPVVFTSLGWGGNLAVEATTCNISSRGVLVETEEDFFSNGWVAFEISWPRIPGVEARKLVVSGRVVRSDSRHAAIELGHREFKPA